MEVLPMKMKLFGIMTALCLCLTLLPNQALADVSAQSTKDWTGWTKLTKASDIGSGSINCYLDDDLVLDKSISVSSASSVMIDLNGHKLSVSSGASCVISAKGSDTESAYVQIIDSSDTHTGAVDGSGTDCVLRAQNNGANIVMSSGTIRNFAKIADISDGADVSISGSTVEVSNKDMLKDAVEFDGSDRHTVKLTGDITIDSTLIFNNIRTLDLNGYVLKYENTQDGSVLRTESGSILDIIDSRPTESHSFTVNSDGLWQLSTGSTGGGVYVQDISGGIITGGHGFAIDGRYYYGGGIHIEGGEVNMSGGNIVGCSSGSGHFGGGVNANNGTFNMSGGSIVGCTASVLGGGVHVSKNAAFNMSGSSSIRSCKVNSTSFANGGGVSVNGKFNMDGNAVIDSCIAEGAGANGGGLYLNSSEAAKMSGNSKISNCKVIGGEYSAGGGGVRILNTSSFTMSDNAAILSCSSENPTGGEAVGGGVSTWIGEFTIEDNVIIDLCSAPSGGGFHNESGTINANGGTICGTVENNGQDSRIIGGDPAQTKFKGTVLNQGTISAGIFLNDVTNTGIINGGNFSSIPDGVYTVKFDSDGGPYVPMQFRSNAPATLPDPAPTKEGYALIGWYSDQALTTPYDFTAIVGENLTLYAKWDITEQFSLTRGATYWFDLSAEDFPGTPNSGNERGAASLPDTSLRWVPFTYAGTVDAYVLNKASNGQSGSSEAAAAATESSAQYGYAYFHSLFIADFAILHSASWNDLNAKDLIFGRNYSAGGIDYVMRAPSTGNSQNNFGNGNMQTSPQNNEWDFIFKKSNQQYDDNTTGYIKNWLRMLSWGQDTYSSSISADYRIMRGSSSALSLGNNTLDTNLTTIGYRPVLEVLNADTLGKDGLKSVTLNLGNAKLGEQSTVYIVVKNGSDFIAPTNEVFTTPNEPKFEGWSDGSNIYQPGESVPSDITSLTAVWQSSGSGGGSSSGYSVNVPSKVENGSVSVSPRHAGRGDAVSITVKPKDGYVLETLKVTDQKGNELPLTDNGDGKYTFAMPFGTADVSATFMEDNSLLNLFYDVPNDAYYYEAVRWAVEKGITNGIGNDLFGANNACTRAQIITFLWRAAGSPEPENVGADSFTDVFSDQYYAKAVAWACENKITAGSGNGAFLPDSACTRAQIVTFLWRAAGSPEPKGAADDFADVPSDEYYAKAVAWAVEKGITNGMGNAMFGSNNACTRAQVVTFLYRAYQGK